MQCHLKESCWNCEWNLGMASLSMYTYPYLLVSSYKNPIIVNQNLILFHFHVFFHGGMHISPDQEYFLAELKLVCGK